MEQKNDSAPAVAVPRMAGRKAADCNCFREVDDHLKTKGGELLCSLFSVPQRVFIATNKKRGHRGKVPLVQASYCPFCGVKYPEDKGILTKLTKGAAPAREPNPQSSGDPT